MAQPIPGINPQLLVWARERAGQSIADVAAALHKATEVIESWEAGTASPTYIQLETLAYKVFKRPVALFFFPEPPDEVDPEHEFRTLPGAEIEELDSHTRLKVREAQALQIQLEELTGGRNPAARLILRDVTLELASPAKSAAAVREYLGVPLSTQTEVWASVDEALKSWRAAVEAVGIFVFKDSFRQRDVSGFSLYKSEFPLIQINNSTAATRQIFTLFHELAHLLVHESGVTKKDDSYIQNLTGNARRVEIFCNAFAAEFLVPSESIRTAARTSGTSDVVVSGLADRYKVSRAVILRRMLDLQFVTKQYYEKKAKKWDEEYEAAIRERKEKGGGGNYYYTIGTYLSDQYTRLAFSQYYRGQISADQLAGYLNVKVKNVTTLEEYMLQKMVG